MALFHYNFKKDANYILACSFGPDSMALFDMLYRAKCKFTVCFVNYHQRPEADSEQESIVKHCKSLNVPIEVLDTKGMKIEGNFQDWARNVRYDFFQKVYHKKKAAAVFVAHQQDDLIETYLIQKTRGGKVKDYGLTETSTLRDMNVIRPLLMYTKDDLLNYCRTHQVPYSIDMSNFETKYLRNKIRQEVIGHMSEIDRANILREIKEANEEQQSLAFNVANKIELSYELEIRELIAMEPEVFSTLIIAFINLANKHVNVSKGCIEEIRKLCLSSKPNAVTAVGGGVYVIKEYDVLTIGTDEQNDLKEYSYVLKKPGVLDTPEFFIDFTKGAEERRIFLTDYPITIRSPKIGDEVEVGNHLCELRRLFIDWKVPSKYRKVWPVFCNKDGKIIYVPRYRKTFVDNHKSKFQIKFTNTKEIKNG